MMLARKALLALCAAALTLSASAAFGGKRLVAGHRPLHPRAQVDNGLGELSPFETWTDPWIYAMPAESLDSGAGDLPPYSEWRYPWVYSMPAEKIDSGLGEIRPTTVSAKPALAERRAQ